MLCKCGCGQEVVQKRSGRVAHYIQGHQRRGKSNTWKLKPESTNKRTLRWRAHDLIPIDTCAMAHIGGCSSKRIEVHHLDRNVCNNDISNLVAVCTTHHRLLENGRITLESKTMPKFYVDKSGKRRYDGV